MAERDARSSRRAGKRRATEGDASAAAGLPPAGSGGIAAETAQRQHRNAQDLQAELDRQSEALRLAREEMESIRARYAGLYDRAPMGCCALDAHGVILESNLTAASILGLPRRDLLQQPFSRFFDADDPGREGGFLLPALPEGASRVVEARLLRGGRDPFWARLILTSGSRPDGAPEFHVVLEDATALKEKEAALKRTEEQATKVFRTIPDGLLVSRVPDGLIVEVNDSFCRLSGWSRPELLGRTVVELNLWADLADREAYLEELRARGRVSGQEAAFRRKDGERRIIALSSEVLSQGPETLVMAITRDVTEQKRGEALLRGQKRVLELVAQEAPLEVSLTALISVLEDQIAGMLCSILVLDADGRHLRHGAAPSLPPEYTRAVDGVEIGPGVGSCGTAAFRRETVVVADIATDPLWEHCRALALPHGLRACWSTPFFDPQGKVLGTFAMYYRQPGTPTAEHQRLIEFGTQVASIAIHRKQVGDELRRSESKFRTLFDSATDGVILLDEKGMFECNQAAVDLFGCGTRAALLAKHPAEVSPPFQPCGSESRALADRRIAAALTEGHQRFEWLHCRVDTGETFPAEVLLTALDLDGRRVLQAVVRDISSRRQAETEAQLMAQRISLATDAAAIGIWDWDLRTNTWECSANYYQIMGQEPEGGVADRDRWIESFHPEDRKAVLKQASRVLSGEAETYEYDARIRQADGSYRWAHVAGRKAGVDPEGRVTRMLGVRMDITARKQAEEALRVKEDLYRDLIENTQEVIATFDLEGNFLSVNAVAARLSGYSRESLLKMNLVELLDPAMRHLFPAYLSSIRSAGKSQGILRVVTAQGETRFWEYTNTLRTVGVPEPVVRGMALDITERMRSEKALRASEARLKVILESTGDGILAVDEAGKVVLANQRFAELWRLPAEVLESGDDQVLIRHVLDQLADPEGFLSKVESLYNSSDTSIDQVRFKDGRCFERYSSPMVEGARNRGRVWSFRDITERVQAEAALAESLQRFELANRATFNVIWDWDLLTQAFWRNDKFETIFGYAPGEMDATVSTSFVLIHPEDVARVDRGIQAALASRAEHWSDTYRFRRKDGSFAVVEDRAVIRRDEAGRPVRMLGAMQDVSEQRGAEQALRASEEKLRMIVEHSRQLFYSYGADGRVAYVSPQVRDFFETGPEDRPRPWTDCLTDHPANAQGLALHRQALATGQRQSAYAVELQTARGRRFWAEVHETPVVQEGRTLAIVGALTDITESRRSDDQLRLQGSALEAAANAILITDRQGLIEWVNRAFTEMTGFTADEAIGLKPGALLASGRHPPSFYAELWSTIAGGEIWRGEMVNRAKDGHIYPEEMTITPVRSGQGEITHFIAIKQDISARKRAERDLSNLNKSLKMLSACNEALVRAQSEPELLEVICQAIVRLGGYRLAWVGYVRDDSGRTLEPVASAGDRDGLLPEVQAARDEGDPRETGPGGWAVRTGKAALFADLSLEPEAPPWMEAMRSRGFRGALGLPLRHGAKTYGALVLCSEDALSPVSEDLGLLQELADDLAFGIHNLRADLERRQMQEAVLKMAQGTSGRFQAASGDTFFDLLARSLVEALQAGGAVIGRLAGSQGGSVETLSFIDRDRKLENLVYALPGTPCASVIECDTCLFEEGIQDLFPEDLMLAEFGIQAYAGTPLRDSKGRTQGLLAVYFRSRIDNPQLVTSTLEVFAARAAGELERLEADARLLEQASMLDKAPDAILVRDLEHRVLFWNKGAERLYGWTSAEALGRSVVDLLFDRPEAFQEPQDRLLAEHEWRGRVVQHRKDGSHLTVEGHWTLVMDEAGKPRAVLAINTDITERVQAEEELHQYTQRLEALREIDAALLGARSTPELARSALVRLRSIVPFERAAVVVFDRSYGEATIVAADQAHPWRPYAGETRPIGDFRDLQELRSAPFLHFPDLSEVARSAVEQLLFSQGLRNHVYIPMEGEGALLGYVALSATAPGQLTPDHAEIALDMADQLAVALQHLRLKEDLERANLRLESKVEERTAELKASVATLKSLQEELRQREAEAWAASEAKSNFLSSMSHELRTPLIGVTGMLEVLNQSPLDAQQRQVVGIIHESSESLLHIIGDILDFSKIEANKLELSLQTVSVRALVESVWNAFRPALSAKGLRFDLQIDPGIAPAHVVDGMRLRQILNNFLSNAVKFTERGSVTLRLRKAGSGEGSETLAFEVQDTGIGVSPEGQAKLFAPFTQAEASTTRRFGGTGLGLVISRRLAELMGGDLRMESEQGRGTTMLLTLPLAVGDERALPKAPAPAPAAADTPRTAPSVEAAERDRSLVLLAEDHPTNRLVITQQVNRAGFALEVAGDGQEAFERWQSGRFALILTDLHMPKMDGIQLTRAVREWEAAHGLPRTPILALTANAVGGEAERCLALGLDDYLVKPVNIPLLATKLHQWLPHVEPGRRSEAPLEPSPAREPREGCLAARVLLDLCEGDAAAAQEVLNDFITTTREDMDGMRAAVERRDPSALARQAHRIKGSATLVGALILGGLARKLEAEALGDGLDWEVALDRIAGLQQALLDLEGIRLPA